MWKNEIFCVFGALFSGIIINVLASDVGDETKLVPNASESKSSISTKRSNASTRTSLIQAHMQFRTGLYTPNSLSQNRNEIYPGLLQPFPELPKLVLTNEGKAQMFKLGQYFQWWYGNNLNYSYNPLEYRMVSSTCVWNIESANVVVAGMFPFDSNDTQKIWNPDLQWWPIPVHLEHKLARRGPTVLLEGTDPPCPRIRKVIQSSSQYNDFLKKWSWLWEYLCFCAKTPEGADFMEALNVAAVLMVDNAYPEKLPTWANSSIVMSSQIMYFDYLRMLSSFPDVLRISTGWWWDLLSLEFDKALNGKSQRKIVQYASHNDMLTACLASISDTIDMWPDWGAGFSVELHMREGTTIVELWGWLNPNQPEPIQLNITDCDAPCTLQKFSKLIRRYHVTDPRFECGTVEEATNSEIPRVVLAVFLLSLISCICSIALVLHKKKQFQDFKSKEF